ncbi:hypothetical protein C1752_03779 [Acaryochloris thomasi RCC1774]|uniref:Iron-binding zinc finger CDGSH type domain-containing protein n=1 Tax=Acaryochloris thomasi RCC1774 TaxID=1764569 RepID=A0A2W1JEJ5_9CYAN|nr:CDGSH iron-sulfur domain-containing protein [Acaryochloris thomasi]PZD72193.1 hypothetical protein C1752_03779 [Acaryochloris thomasi RCC1774]
MSQHSATSSATAHLETGTHWICSCGLSKNAPYCDGGHQSTSLQPIELEVQAPKVVEISY